MMDAPLPLLNPPCQSRPELVLLLPCLPLSFPFVSSLLPPLWRGGLTQSQKHQRLGRTTTRGEECGAQRLGGAEECSSELCGAWNPDLILSRFCVCCYHTGQQHV